MKLKLQDGKEVFPNEATFGLAAAFFQVCNDREDCKEVHG